MNLNRFKNIKGYNYCALFGAYFLLTFIIYLPLILIHCIPAWGDASSRLNVFYFVNIALKDGEFPFWNDYQNIGRPYFSDFSNMLFYPVRIIFSWLPELWFFYFYYAFHVALSSTFFALYLKEIKCSKLVSLLFSFAYYFSVFMGGQRKCHILLFTCMAYLPVIMYFVQRFMNTSKRRYLYASSIFMAIQFIVEFPQLALYTDIFVGIYLLFLMIINRREIKKCAVDLISWVSLYFGLIAIKIIPYAFYSSYLNKEFSSSISLKYFKSYSTKPVQLFRLLSPLTVPENTGDLAPENFWELFFGSVSISLLILAVTYIRKNRYVGIILGLLSASTAYTVAMSFTKCAEVFYKIPLLSEFRCTSRIYFAIEFFGMVLAAIGAEQLIKNNAFKRFLIILLTNTAFVTIASVILHKKYMAPEEYSIKTAFLDIRTTLLCMAVAILATLFVIKNNKKSSIAIGFIALTIAFELLPLWLVGTETNMDEFGNDTPAEDFIYNLDTNDKFFTTNIRYSGRYSYVIGWNGYIPLRASFLNSYTNLNNPQLSMLLSDNDFDSVQINDAGRFTAFPNMNNILTYYNDILSCLGVRYIIDEGDRLSEDTVIYDTSLEMETVYEIPYMHCDRDGIVQESLILEPHQVYCISFESDDVFGEFEDDTVVYWDFYGNENYDSLDQQRKINLFENCDTYYFYINSGDTSVCDGRVLFRVVTRNAPTDFTLRNIKISKVPSIENNTPYSLIYEDSSCKIYENTNYREMIYVPDEVRSVRDSNDLFFNKTIYDFDDISYIVDADELVTSPATITDIDHHHNYTTASVNATGDTFINFAQTYDEGWSAYIDGKEVPVYRVNGYIQGIYVPEGKHEIKFSYRPVGLIPAIIIESATLVVLLSGYALMVIKERKINN